MSKFLTTNGIDYIANRIRGATGHKVLIVALLWVGIASASAGIGESAIQLADLYGPPKDTLVAQTTDKTFPLIESGIHHTYEYQGWKIRAAFLQVDGPCVRLDYQKIVTTGVKPQIQDYELQAIATGNTPVGMTWKRVMYNNADSPNKGLSKLAEAYFAGSIGHKMWQRNDGAILWLRGPLVVRLELPAVHQYEEQLKAAKEQKARESVPKF